MAITLDGTNGINSSGVIVAPDGSASAPSITNDGDTNTGIFFPAADTIAFAEGGAEAMRINSSGQVGIGTDSPSRVLTVAGTSFNNCEITRYSSNAGGPNLYIQKSRGASVGTNTVVQNNDASGNITFAAADGTDFIACASISAAIDGTPGTNDMPGRLIFSTTADGGSSVTERARITSGGEFYVAGTTDQGAYNIQCNGTGVWGAGAYVNGSDERIKNDITPIESGLDVVEKLNPVTYRYKESWSKDQSTQTGFIAQELLVALDDQNYVDGVVQQGGSEGYYSVAYQNIIPILTKAIQELKAINDAQASRIETLEAKVAALEAQS